MYRYFFPILIACTPITTPEPTPTPEPSVEPTPIPDPVLVIPLHVPVGTPFAVSLCDGPFVPNRVVKIDEIQLGTLGWNAASGCSMLIVPGLSGSGVRTLSAGNLSSLVKVLPKR